MINKLLLLVLITLIVSCNLFKNHTIKTKSDSIAPPGTIEISDNLFFDKTEITNFGWVEYLFWMESVYGKNGDSYIEALPDTNVWSELNVNYSSLDTFYLRHPAYYNFPVVGISYEQAIQYSQWRSDRLMELQLIRYGKIPFTKPTNSKDSTFTIKKYLDGQFLGFKPSEDSLFYPQYSLPDSATFFRASHFADSINSKNYKHCKEKYCSEQSLIECNCIENKPFITDSLPYGPTPTFSTSCSSCKKELITHLKGNIREMTDIQGQFYGLSFINSCELNYNKCRSDSALVNSYTGFRNICSYKKWKRK